jgi:hypothetical protein
MGFSITSNYSGEHAGQYIAAALKSATSLEYLNVLENVKFKRNITKVAGASLVANASCDFSDAGTLTLTERVLNPKELQINVDLCKKDLLADWQAAQMRAGAHNRDMSGDFTAFVMSYLSGTIADAVEGSIWSGAEATGGQFEGFLTATTGYFATDGTVGTDSASAAYDANNVIANIQGLVAAIPAQVYTKEDLYIYMNAKTYRFYISAISALSAFPFNHMGQYTPEFEGVKIAVCQGMPDNQMVAAQKSNLFFGTDLISDHSEIRMLDMSDLDGSDNIRVVAKFTAGVQHGIGADIVHQS